MSETQAIRSGSQSLVPTIWSGLVLGLFLVRFSIVAESAPQGETLWIVALWFLALLIAAIIFRRFPSRAVSFGWLDLSVALFAGGHIASAILVIGTTGEKRSAINMAWEWAGVAIGWFLVHYACGQERFRREMLASIIAIGATTSGLGVYQHYIAFPQLAAKYGSLYDRLKHADPAEAASIRQILVRDQIPVDGAAAILFEKRLRDSREPFGMFGLANTLGGLLSVCLILTASVSTEILKNGRSNAWRVRLTEISIVALLGWCLLLTKSRTAWIGTAAGLVAWMIGSGRFQLTGKRIRGIVGILLFVAMLGWGLFQIGGLDRQVLTEAPKSLQYRLQYWSATWPMIRDHMWCGVGPGQFRSHYLFYKNAEASEEISDPHNLFLDAAANGGLAAFAGLLMVCFLVVGRLSSRDSNVDEIEDRSNDNVIPLVITIISVIGWCVLLFNGDDECLVLLPAFVAIYWWQSRLLRGRNGATMHLGVATRSAAIGLIVHLLGAGGIGMPAMSLLLLNLVSMSRGGTVSATGVCRRSSAISCGIMIFVSIALLAGLYFTGLRPVSEVQQKMREGNRLVQMGFVDEADKDFSMAAASDDCFGEPWRRRAELAYRKAEAGRFASNEMFLNAVRDMDEVRLRDPVNPHDEKRLGDWWMSRWRITKRSADVEEAVAAYERAWKLYPTNAPLMAELAFALDASGKIQASIDVARKSLEQNRINRKMGHVDRYLSDSVCGQLERLIDIQKQQSGNE